MSSNAAKDESRIGDFVLENEIGKGSFAVVHRGYRVSPRQPVAVKVVTRKKLTPKLMDQLEAEIAILKAIHHPNIVELKECLKTDTQIFLVMEFCAAGDLSQYIRKRYDIFDRAGLSRPYSHTPYPHPADGGLNETIVRSILTQLAAAIEFMRARDIIHRDFKPQNLLLHPPDEAFLALGNPKEIPQVKVADFGFARHLSAEVMAETLCGSPLYMAPEILNYEKYDAKADLWSVGAVVFEMTVGKPPFKANNHVELLKRIRTAQDKIKFPDERSAGSLAREAARRQELGEAPLPPPHPVSEDLKALIRQLLRQRPVSRMSFEDFFRNSVITDFKAFIRPRAQPAAVERYEDLQRSERSMILPSSGIQDASVSSIGSGSGKQATLITAATSKSEQGNESRPRGDRRASRESQDATNELASPRDGGSPAQLSGSRPSPRSVPRAFTSRYVTGEPSPPTQTAHVAAPAIVRVPSSPGVPDRSLLPHSREADSPSPTAAAGPSNGEDSFLGKEYVMVEKRNVEVNALADELAATPQSRLSTMARRPSRLSRLSTGNAAGTASTVTAAPTSSAAGTGASPPAAVGTATGSSPIRIGSGTPPPATSAWANAGPFALPPGARPSSFPRRTSLSSSGSPSPRLGGQGQVITAVDAAASAGSARRDIGPGGGMSGPNDEVSILGSKPGLGYPTVAASSGPSSALARAISMASLRLFGVPSGVSLRDAATLVRTRAQRRTGLARSSETMDEEEANLLNTLEDLGQKSFVLSEFADSKLASFFPDGPHQLSQDLDASVATGVSPGRGSSYHGTPRRMGSVSSSSSALDPLAAEAAAAEALMLYVRCLTFLQRAISLTKTFLDGRSRPGRPATASVELNEVVQWLRARFNEGYDKADFARSKCGEIPESAQQVDKLIFDKAVEVARAAAMDELENNREGSGWEPGQCLLAYETASSMLMSLLDLGEDGMSMSEGSISMIEKYVKSINKRLTVLQDQFSGGNGGIAGSGTTTGASPSATGNSTGFVPSPLSNNSVTSHQ
ncbi:kinase-like protein [Testicularia cyperi]|uniref:non-specific serine/threonine protein kinase n=1 Tax=Testicularia cyperi TaxID=1882483 RepID=A0A317XQ75_9BASI|nr:kinase-like protein [Testicularia cyperi]